MSPKSRDERRVESLLAEQARSPAPALAGRVLTRLEADRTTSARPPQRIPPLLRLAMATAALVLVSGVTGYLAGRARSTVPMIAAEGPALRTVHFALSAPGASTVVLVGDFNGWNPDEGTPLVARGERFVAAVELPPGRYAYGFVVDGSRVVPDPDAPATEADGFGGLNSVLEL